MFGGLYNIVFTDYPGGSADLSFIENADWLKDAAVINDVYELKGNWKVRLIFVWINEPMRFICRHINDSFTRKSKAAMAADFYHRTSQKDKRGTLTISANDFIINYN